MTTVAVGLVLVWVVVRIIGLVRPSPAAHQRWTGTVVVVDRHTAVAEQIAGVDGDAGEIAVAVVGPGESVSPRALQSASAAFSDPAVGAVQPAIRSSRRDTLLARLQDLEWVGVVDVHAAHGQAAGALGVGPASPLYRLSALRQLDLETASFGDVATAVALAEAGWTLAAAPTVVVTREPAASVGALVRGRAGAVRDLLTLAPAGFRLLRRDRKLGAALLAPIGLLLVGLAAVAVAVLAVADPRAFLDLFGGWHLVVWYGVLFAPAWVGAFSYWARTADVGFLRALGLGHVFVVYSLHWVVAAWMAVLGLLFRRAPAEGPQSTDVAAR